MKRITVVSTRELEKLQTADYPRCLFRRPGDVSISFRGTKSSYSLLYRKADSLHLSILNQTMMISNYNRVVSVPQPNQSTSTGTGNST